MRANRQFAIATRRLKSDVPQKRQELPIKMTRRSVISTEPRVETAKVRVDVTE